jgi:ABC-type multidrug transport system ATPase subunit
LPCSLRSFRRTSDNNTPVLNADSPIRHLRDFGIMGNQHNRLAEFFSADFKQTHNIHAALTVEIARAIASKPAIVLADEPTGNLDSKSGMDVMGLLQVSGEKFGQTIVLITHNPEIAQMADRTVRIEDGRIVGGTSAAVRGVFNGALDSALDGALNGALRGAT